MNIFKLMNQIVNIKSGIVKNMSVVFCFFQKLNLNMLYGVHLDEIYANARAIEWN